MCNIIVEEDGKFYHPEQFAAPYGWARVSGLRVELKQQAGLWCEITEDQKPFCFKSEGDAVTITSGFRNPDFNGTAVATFTAGVLLKSNLDEMKSLMKVRGLPSCTRINLRRDFLVWFTRGW